MDRMDQLNLAGKRVLIREDLNVPLKEGRVENDTRIRAAIPTIESAVAKGASVILMSHLGRPQEGVPIERQQEFSLAAVAEHLGELLGQKVELIQDYLQHPSQLANMGSGVVLLENVRINEGEKANSDALAKQYAALCDVFVMDAFGTAHRAQSSTHGVAKFAALACAGPLLARELDALGEALSNPVRPMLAIVGGAKVSSKLEVLQNLAEKVDQLIVGGGIANTFLMASGIDVGKSLVEVDLLKTAEKLMQYVAIPLPSDVVVSKEFSADARAETKPVTEIEADDMIMDIGPDSAAALSELITGMKTILWNGPMGVFEFDQFSKGTEVVARAIANNNGFSLAGGGETISAIDKFSLAGAISYISTGGGAFLEFVQGAELPAVQILQQRSSNN